MNNEDKTWWRGLVRWSNKLIVSDWPNNPPNISIQQILFYGWRVRRSEMCKRQIFGSIFDVRKLIGFQKNPIIGREEGFGITDKLLGFIKICVIGNKSIYRSKCHINEYMVLNIYKIICLNISHTKIIVFNLLHCSIDRFHVIVGNLFGRFILNIDYW